MKKDKSPNFKEMIGNLHLYFVFFLFVISSVGIVQAETTQTIITPNTRADYDYFGKTVSLNGEYAFVSYRNNNLSDPYGGRVEVLKLVNGQWESQQTLHQATNVCYPGQSVNTTFGQVIVSQGEWLFIGAPEWKPDCSNDKNFDGTVFIYKRNGNQYVQHQKVPHPFDKSKPAFGNSISVSGDWLFIGAQNVNNGGGNFGAAYAFQYNNNTDQWEYKQSLDRDGDITRGLGSAVAVDGNHALVGSAYGIMVGGNISQRGVVYCYELNNDVWDFVEKLEYYDLDKTNARFGNSIAISGDIAVIGTGNYDSRTTARTASIYHYVDGNWEFKQVVEKPAESTYGLNVATEGEYVLVASETGTATGGQSTSGVVHLYHFDGDEDEWVLEKTIFPSDGVSNGKFGEAIAVNQGRILIGSPSHAYPTYKGQTYLYEGAIEVPPVPSIIAKFSASDAIIGMERDVHFTDLSTAENTTITSWSWDFNGDGVEDSADQNPTYQFTSPRVNTVSLTVSDGTISSTSHTFITVLSASEDTCFVYIPFKGLEREGMGAAAWNVIDGNGSEPLKFGHELPQPPASIQVAYYYLASRDYGGITPGRKGAMHALEGIQGWPNLSQALIDNGFTPEDLTVTFGLTTLGNDIQGQDWQLYGNYETRTYTGGMFNIFIGGERIIHGLMPDFDMSLEYQAYLGGNDKISGKTKQAIPNNSTGKESSQAAVNVAEAFMEDCGDATLMFLFSSIQPAKQFEFQSNSRWGGFFDIEQGFIVKACPEDLATSISNYKTNNIIKVTHKESTLTISNLEDNSRVFITDMSGRIIYNQKSTNGKLTSTLIQSGAYLLMIDSPSGRQVRKVMIQ